MNVSELHLFTLTCLGAALLQAGGQPSGVRAQDEPCIEDGDCAQGMRCAYRDDEVCVDRPGETPDCSPAQEGECEPAPIACDDDADCPLALSCETRRTVEECSVAPARAGDPVPDAGAAEDCTRMAVAVEEPQCVYDLVACTQDSDCDDDFPCQPLGREEACSDSPANCAPGESCAPSEPTCTTTRVHSYCFPARMDCSDDGDCSAGWRCAELPEDAQEHPAEGWEGASRVCLPEGIALFLEGRVEAGASSSSSSDQATSRAGGVADASEEDGAESAPAGDAPGANSSCSVRPGTRGPGQGMLTGAWLLAFALALVRARRPRHA